MSLRVTCPGCSASFAAGPELFGRQVSCPRCRGPIQVPGGVDSLAPNGEIPGTQSASPQPASPQPSRSAADASERRSRRFKGAEAIGTAAGGAAKTSRTGAAHHESHVGSAEAVSVGTLEHPEEDDAGSVSLRPKEQADNAEMDMTPMVDVTFLLLIFFMVTASFSMQKTMQLPRSKSDEPSITATQIDPEEEPESVTVIVDSFNTFTVETSDWIREAPSEQELLIALRDAVQTGGEPPNKLILKAHVDSNHEKAVAALDAGAEVGMQELQYSTITEDP